MSLILSLLALALIFLGTRALLIDLGILPVRNWNISAPQYMLNELMIEETTGMNGRAF